MLLKNGGDFQAGINIAAILTNKSILKLFLDAFLSALHVFPGDLSLLLIHKLEQVLTLHFLYSVAQHFSHALVDKDSVAFFVNLPDAFIKVFNQQAVFCFTVLKRVLKRLMYIQ